MSEKKRKIKTAEPESERVLWLEKTVIARPLFNAFKTTASARKKTRAITTKTAPQSVAPVFPVIIDINLMFKGGREKAKAKVEQLIVELLADNNVPKLAPVTAQGINLLKTKYSQQYVFAVLEESVIKALVARDQAELPGVMSGARAIFRIWPDFEIQSQTTKSCATVKADAARNAFSALGAGIYWAVMDSGIDGTHPHFIAHQNLAIPVTAEPLQHCDFTQLTRIANTVSDAPANADLSIQIGGALQDEYGHGTHVAGIIAGEMIAKAAVLPAVSNDGAPAQQIIATTKYRDENDRILEKETRIEPAISGMAPACKLISLKVLDQQGRGHASNLIAAIQWIQEINGYGRHIRIHGVNMSVGYEFDPEWFACGQSPLCVEVDRLVRSGVVVVAAAGNTGYGFVQAKGKKTAVTAGLDLTINDPGNAAMAITVGSTHREMPHIYGVSYFSSKGPTGDGRLKPDLVAPGEKIISCDSAQRRLPAGAPLPVATDVLTGYYREDSGTSMAAPHVSGVIAAFLSVRREFIGRPEAIKEIFLSTATDLKRERYFQGHGLVDLMRAIQSV